MFPQDTTLSQHNNNTLSMEDVLFNIKLLFPSQTFDNEFYRTQEQTLALLNSLFNFNFLNLAEAINYASTKDCIFDLALPFSESKALLLVSFFTTLLQTERVLKLRTQNNSNITASPKVSTFHYNIKRMLNVLQTNTKKPTTNTSIINLMKLVRQEITNIKSNPLNNASNQSLIDRSLFNTKEKEICQEIMNDLNIEYRMRRRMMLQRLDVTLQSFMWSKKAIGIENEIIAVLKPLVSQLHALKFDINEEMLFQATSSLTDVQCSSVSATRSKAAIKDVLIGTVPDRGGRVDEFKPKDLMPSWKLRGSGKSHHSKQNKQNKQKKKTQQHKEQKKKAQPKRDQPKKDQQKKVHQPKSKKKNKQQQKQKPQNKKQKE